MCITAVRHVPVWFPSWFPGVEVKRYTCHIGEMNEAVMNVPVEELKARRVRAVSPLDLHGTSFCTFPGYS